MCERKIVHSGYIEYGDKIIEALNDHDYDRARIIRRQLINLMYDCSDLKDVLRWRFMYFGRTKYNEKTDIDRIRRDFAKIDQQTMIDITPKTIDRSDWLYYDSDNDKRSRSNDMSISVYDISSMM